MEKTTKKKKSKRLKRRIGLIAVGGLSLVLTVCLSVGATLAWFAGTTYASNDMYMGGPVYVEMAGRGHAGATTGGDGKTEGKWVGGDGSLDIFASLRENGTAKSGYDASGNSIDSTKYKTTNILLPGQKLQVYSQARVYSTAYYDDITAGYYKNQSSGANTTNITNGTAMYTSSSGVKKTTTTSVLRAKFSIDVEFDPTVGVNNFTNPAFANGYPLQSKTYSGQGNVSGTTAVWSAALYTSANESTIKFNTVNSGTDGLYTESETIIYTGRRDAIESSDTTHAAYDQDGKEVTDGSTAQTWVTGSTANELWAVKNGVSKCIYKWKYVSSDEYEKAEEDNTGAHGIAMGAPFNGKYNTAGTASSKNGGYGNGYYGVFVTAKSEVGTSYEKVESDAFYKARCNAYLESYKEHWRNENGIDYILTIGKSISKLEEALNEEFVTLVNKSSDAIIKSKTKGFTVDTTTGNIVYSGTSASATNASWLYVDPSIGNDTNASDSATSTGGWWYLVANSNDQGVTTGLNEVKTVYDSASKKDDETGNYIYNASGDTETAKNVATAGSPIYRNDLKVSGHSYTSGAIGYDSTDTEILNAQLFEIVPSALNGVVEEVGTGTGTYKVVSESFPFVNGSFVLPGKELTNNFANAKITFKITFQAVQAFFPYTHSIDGCKTNSTLSGTGKALNIYNAIPIFNEAFDYLSYLSN